MMIDPAPDPDPRARAVGLSCWPDPVEPEPIPGGITNTNYVVESGGQRYFVRIGDDIAVHGVMRFNELAASRAAHAVGVSPEVVHHEPGALVMRFIEGRTLAADDIRDPKTLLRVIDLVKRCHLGIPGYLHGPALVFWVFQVVRDYSHTLREIDSRFVPDLARFLEAAAALEAEVGRVSLVFGHNDLLASNFIDDGERLWMVDWDYAGFNSPLFDLSGLASNNHLGVEQERGMLEEYFAAPVTLGLWRRYTAMRCASLLREAMWSMVSEHHSKVDYDFVAYSDANLVRFDAAWARFQSEDQFDQFDSSRPDIG